MFSIRPTMIVMVIASVMLKHVQATPLTGECTINSHCGPSACCLVGYDRYSFPQCSPLGDVGSWCRTMGIPTEMTLAYPNGLMIHLQEAYNGMCPCRPGLVCSRMSSTCQLPDVSSQLPVVSGQLPGVSSQLPVVSGQLPGVSSEFPDVSSEEENSLNSLI